MKLWISFIIYQVISQLICEIISIDKNIWGFISQNNEPGRNATAGAWCPRNFQNPIGLRSTSQLAEGFFKPEILFVDIHGYLGKHLKSFDHASATPWLAFVSKTQAIWRRRLQVKAMQNLQMVSQYCQELLASGFPILWNRKTPKLFLCTDWHYHW